MSHQNTLIRMTSYLGTHYTYYYYSILFSPERLAQQEKGTGWGYGANQMHNLNSEDPEHVLMT